MGIVGYSYAVLLAREVMARHMFGTGAISLPKVDESEPVALLYASYGRIAALAVDGPFPSLAAASAGAASQSTRSLQRPLRLNYRPSPVAGWRVCSTVA